MIRRLCCAALGWVADKPTGNRLRWTYAGDIAVPAPPGGGAPNQRKTAFGEPPAPGWPVPAIVVERAPVPANEKPTERPGAPAELRSIPASWWSPAGDLRLRGRGAFVEHALARSVHALAFDYRGPSTRCVVRAVDGQIAADGPIEPGATFFALGAELASIAFYTSEVILHDLELLDLARPRELRFVPIARIDVAAGVDGSLDDAATRLEIPIPDEAGDGDWWDGLAAACRGEPGPGEPDDPSLPGPALRATATRASRFWVAVLTGAGFVDGPGRPPSRVPGDAVAGEPLTSPAWVAYRVVEDPGEEAEPLVSNVAFCPPAIAAPLRPPAELAADVTVASYVRQRDVYELATVVRWRDLSPAATVLDELAVDASSGAVALAQSVDCRRPRRDGPRSSFPRRLDVLHREVMLRWRAHAVDTWDRISGSTAWTADHRPVLQHRPPGPAFARATRNGEVVLLRPASPVWEPDRCVRESGGRLNVYRATRAPEEIEVTLRAAKLAGDGVYGVTVAGGGDLARFAGGTLITGGTWHVSDGEPGEVTILAPADGAGSVRLPAHGAAYLRESSTRLALYRLVASLPVDALAALPADADGELYLELRDPVDPAGGPLAYRAAVEVEGRVGVLGPAVVALSPAAAVAAPGFAAAVYLAVEPASIGSGAADFFGRTLVVVTLDAPAAAGAGYRVFAAAGTAGSDDPPATLARGLFGEQSPADGRTVYELVPLGLPLPSGTPIWVAVEARLADGRVSVRGVERAVIV